MKNLKVKYIRYGTANRVNQTVYMNKAFKKYPWLESWLLEHEYGHTSEAGTVKDALHEIKDLFAFKEQFWITYVMLRHPSMLWQLSPVMKLDSEWFIDWTAIQMYCIWAVILGTILWWVL